jgi:hypothetical protein
LTPEERARAQAEAALKEHGWEPITPGCWWQGELAVGRSADGKYEVSLWDTPDAEPGVRWLCDVGLTPPDSEKEALWMWGIPRPDGVPALLLKHADILSVGHDGRTLDLATGEVLVEVRTIIRDAIRGAEGRLNQYGDAARALDAVGWSVREVRLGLDGNPDTIIAKRRSEGS